MKFLKEYTEFNNTIIMVYQYNDIVENSLPIDKSIKYFNYFKSEKYKDCKFVVAVNNNLIVGYYAKILGDSYQYGYIESIGGGIGSRLMKKMSELGRYISFVRICNIPSIKMHFKANPINIIQISEKENVPSQYQNDINEGTIGYRSELGYCSLNSREISDFILKSSNITLVYNGEDIHIKYESTNTKGIGNIKIFMQF